MSALWKKVLNLTVIVYNYVFKDYLLFLLRCIKNNFTGMKYLVIKTLVFLLISTLDPYVLLVLIHHWRVT